MAPAWGLSSSKGVQMRGMAKDLRNRTQHRGNVSKAVTAYVQGECVGIRPPIVKVRPTSLNSILANFRDLIYPQRKP